MPLAIVHRSNTLSLTYALSNYSWNEHHFVTFLSSETSEKQVPPKTFTNINL